MHATTGGRSDMARPPDAPIATIGRALRTGHWFVWSVALLGLALALGAVAVRPPTYQATAMLNVDESQIVNQGFDVALQADQYLSQRYINMATSQAVLSAVCAREGDGCTPSALARQVSGGTTKATGQVVITARARSGVAASRIANEDAAAVVAQNQAYVTRLLTSQRQLLQQHLTQLSADMAGTEKAIDANAVLNRDSSGLVAQLTVEGNQYQTTYTRIQDLDIQQAQLISGLTIQQLAARPSKPVDPDPLLYIPIGLVGGLTIGFFFALVAERFRKRVVDAGELAEISGSDLALTLNPGEAPLMMGSYGLLSQRSPAGDSGTSQVLLVAASPEVPVDEIAVEVASAMAAEGRNAIVAPAGVGPALVEDRGLMTGGAAPRPRRLDGAGADLVIRYVSPLARPALWLDSSVGPAVLVAVRRRTRLRDVRRTSELLRHTGLQPMAVVLLKWLQTPARRDARETREVAATGVIHARHADEQASSSQASM